MYQYNLNQYFKEISKKYKNKTALIDINDKKYTYGYLDKKSDMFASKIQNFKKEDLCAVGIDSKKNVNTIIAFLGCLKSGVTYFFLDLNLPNKRIKKIIKKTKCKILISDEKKNKLFAKVISIKTKTNNKKITIRNCSSDNPAYIMFTSGSTGEPKGAIISQQSIINFINWSRKSFKITPKDIFSQLNPLYFDNSVFDLFNSLFNGSTLVLTNGLEIENPVNLLKKIKKNKCSIWFSTPSLLIYFLNFDLLDKIKFKFINKIIFGGEGFPKQKLINLIKKVGRKSYYNVYGPTECTCICSRHLIDKSDLVYNKESYVTLGKIAENFDYLILNNKNKIVKPGKVGELVLFGPNVAYGYIGDDEITRKNFIYGKKYFNYQRGYRTGDLVYYNPKQDKIYFVGRKDTQVKHLGYRIELNELEVTLNKHAQVNEAFVFYLKNKLETHGKIIAVLSVKKKIEKSEILFFLKKYLPKYFLPKYVFFTKNLLKNSSNKIDRVKLKKIYEKKI